MSVTANSRHEPPFSPLSMMSTPSRSSYFRAQNNISSYSPTVTSGGTNQHKLNVVTRVAIEGKAKQGQDGASIRMFLKICVPLDSVTPGSTVPLFPEENVKIHTSQVHPLDQNGVPYNFSSTVFPLLHNAARALSLPQRLHKDFNTFVKSSHYNGNTISSRSPQIENGDKVSPIDVQYTGQILVSGYNISFVLPKIFPPRRRDDNGLDTGGTPASKRRPSIGERNQAFYMAAIDMWIPFLGRPPRSPYLLSIPSPRCLQNYMKLRIFPPPVNTSSSFASLSSMEEDSAAWDLTSEPHVTRTSSSKPSRSNSYNNFADDESSDSSAAHATDACIIQGTFPSVERIRIRWAKPTKYLDIPGDESGRRRVGVEESKGEMSCIIRGKGTSASNPQIEGVLMHVEYKGQCQGIWFAGVATLLGLDVGLEAKGSDVSWPHGYPNHWEVSGAAGYTGFGTGPSSEPSMTSRTTSLDSNGPQPQPSSPSITVQDSAPDFLTARTSSSSSSLLRAPLPVSNVGEYSFEGSTSTLPSSNLSPSEILSSNASLPNPSHANLSQPSPTHPGAPITLHLNINELQTPVKNIFTFTISGTILVTARTVLARLHASTTSLHGKQADLEPIVLPRFTVLAADTESTSILIRNEVDSAAVEVFNPTGDIQHDPQTRKTVLQKNGFTRCSEDGARIALKYFDTLYPPNVNSTTRPPTHPRTPSNNAPYMLSSSPNPRKPHLTRSKPDGPYIIPSVKVTVTPLAPNIDHLPTGYAVRVTLQTPPLVDSEWLHFGIACGSPDVDNVTDSGKPHLHGKVHIICASLDGVPVRSETTRVAKAASDITAEAAPFEELGGKEWICWVKAHVGSSVGGSMVIDYIVKKHQTLSGKDTKKCNEVSALEILLPTFFMSVARLEVYVDYIPGLDISSLRSNFDYHYALSNVNRLLRYSVEEYSRPHLSLMVQKSSVKHAPPGLKWYFISTWSILLVAFCLIYQIMDNMCRLHRIDDSYFSKIESWSDTPALTVTTTVYASTGLRCRGELPIETSNFILSEVSSTSSAPSSIPTPISPLKDSVPTIAAKAATQESLENPTIETLLAKMSPLSVPETYGLMPVENNFSFKWLSSNAFQYALEEVVATMEVVWGIFRKVYHYPLDPP